MWLRVASGALAALAGCAEEAATRDATVATDVGLDVAQFPDNLARADADADVAAAEVGVDVPARDVGPPDTPSTNVPVDPREGSVAGQQVRWRSGRQLPQPRDRDVAHGLGQ